MTAPARAVSQPRVAVFALKRELAIVMFEPPSAYAKPPHVATLSLALERTITTLDLPLSFSAPPCASSFPPDSAVFEVKTASAISASEFSVR